MARKKSQKSVSSALQLSLDLPGSDARTKRAIDDLSTRCDELQIVGARTCDLVPNDPPTEQLAQIARAVLDELESWRNKCGDRIGIDGPTLPQVVEHLVHSALLPHIETLRALAPGRPDTAVARELDLLGRMER